MNLERRIAITLVVATTLGASGCALSHERALAAQDASILLDAPIFLDAHAIDAGPCAAPTAYFEPGCGPTDLPITRGCYQACEGAADARCGAGAVCQRTDVNPCLCGPGLDCCAACGAEQWLCLPPPTTTPCAGRSYCDCSASDGCEPLIDLTTGCVCPCDEPFVCGGPPCDCDCGGATYLGCASAGACTTPQISCPPGRHALVVSGCPDCVGTR